MTILPQLERDLLEAARQRPADRTDPAGERPRRRGLVGILAPVAAVVVVLAVAAVFLGTHAHNHTPAAAPGKGSQVEVVFTATAIYGQSSLAVALRHATAIMRSRLAATIRGAKVSSAGGQITVVVPHAPAGTRARIIALAASGQLALYDWEANALTPNGKAVAGQLAAQDPTALEISQGGAASAPGGPGAGGMSLYQAVSVASRQPAQPSASNTRTGPEYFMFGAPGSAACTTAARDRGTRVAPGGHCLLAGPVSEPPVLPGLLPVGVKASAVQTLSVPRGIVVLEAASAEFTGTRALTDPAAQFFVLRDRAALIGSDITNPHQGADASGQPDVEFGFTSTGARAFQTVTAQISQRGEYVSRLGQTLDQHFALAFGTQLISVPSIDFKEYPQGISPGNGADVSDGFTPASAQLLATLLRFSPLPVMLVAR